MNENKQCAFILDDCERKEDTQSESLKDTNSTSEDSPKEDTLEKNPVKVSSALYRLDRQIKCIIRGSVAILKILMDKLLVDVRKEHGVNLRRNSEAFKFYLKSYLERLLNIERLEDIMTDDEFKYEIYPVCLYVCFKGRYQEKISKSFRLNERQKMIRQLKLFLRYNNPKGCLGEHREYSITHLSMRVAKCLFSNYNFYNQSFWRKVLGRKNLRFDNLETFKNHVLFIMDSYISDIE